MWYFVPPQDFFAYIQDPLEHMFLIGIVLSIAAFLIYDVIILKEDFCVYICPYSRVQSVLYDNNTYQAIYSTKRGGKVVNSYLIQHFHLLFYKVLYLYLHLKAYTLFLHS